MRIKIMDGGREFKYRLPILDGKAQKDPYDGDTG